MRIIPRLDVKGQNLIKGIQLEGLRVLGDPAAFAVNYYHGGADEIILMDSVASLYGRNNLFDLIEKITQDIFIPITLGGGLRSRADVNRALRSGADKFAINSAAIEDINIIREIAEAVGVQSVVLSVEAKKVGIASWEAYFNNGREKSGIEVREWIDRCVDMGAGEILLTSVDREGTRSGFDMDLLHHVGKKILVPLIVSGGIGSLNDVKEIALTECASAIAIADAFHYQRHSIREVKATVQKLGFDIRL
ncbi:MAG: imidazole glycerol phosphate synthase subunit HisF [Pelagibacteraceae bacterium TMED65]|nr:MAG: imidazole glycerol phosphate synthase subunit HisF [Pelagibacteraceae bacterium TMED65]|tara:strand:+ start:55 stop:804 length:750 start_codon:yes stop_codon:yes gene_type:complete